MKRIGMPQNFFGIRRKGAISKIEAIVLVIVPLQWRCSAKKIVRTRSHSRIFAGDEIRTRSKKRFVRRSNDIDHLGLTHIIECWFATPGERQAREQHQKM